ncbi:Asp-tRNA(Asn)/Glu-tRNA(Gln) amidotransferase subunit GatA [Candidatus Woesearchaeota archaeon]|nr:Asp-tRNA(Asn)/Glu-tRNA(Gln) amidotransferase subunit GatA [Candidatus Woesearchaeota archaeon]
MNTKEFIKKVKNKEIDIVEHTEEVIEKARNINKRYHLFNIISDDSAIEQAKTLKKEIKKNNIKNKSLLGVPISVKDCVCVNGVESRAGSKILNGYKPVFDATVIKKIKEQGGIIIGKTAQDEFGFGTFSVNVGVDFKIPLNPLDKERSCGGSSGGAAGISQIADFPHIAIGESTGGSIVAPASFCGVFGLCPTYGRVSRYGLIDYANSMDKIGTLGKTIEDNALLLKSISGHDDNDSTSINSESDEYSSYLKKGIKNIKIGIINESFGEGVEKEVTEKVMGGINKLEENGAKTEKVSLPLTSKYGVQAYYLIAVSETSTNLAKLCGMRYGRHEELTGNFNEYFTKVRSKNFGEEAKRRIILGTFTRMAGYRDAYYMKAMKVRTKIIEEYKKAFKKFDLLVSPTMPFIAPKFSEIEKLSPLQNYMADIMTVGPNLAGLPHLNVPVGLSKKMPVGMLLIGNHLEEGKLMQVGNIFNQ